MVAIRKVSIYKCPIRGGEIISSEGRVPRVPNPTGKRENQGLVELVPACGGHPPACDARPTGYDGLTSFCEGSNTRFGWGGQSSRRWWGERPREPASARQSEATAARQQPRPTRFVRRARLVPTKSDEGGSDAPCQNPPPSASPRFSS
jgi:hypothetical protein